MDSEQNKLIETKAMENHNLLLFPMIYSIISFCFYTILVIVTYVAGDEACHPSALHMQFVVFVARCIISNFLCFAIMCCFLVRLTRVKMTFYILMGILVCLSIIDFVLCFVLIGKGITMENCEIGVRIITQTLFSVVSFVSILAFIMDTYQNIKTRYPA